MWGRLDLTWFGHLGPLTYPTDPLKIRFFLKRGKIDHFAVIVKLKQVGVK